MLAQTCWHCENQQTAWVFRKRKLKVKELLNYRTWRSKRGADTQMDLKFKCNKCNRDFLTVTAGRRLYSWRTTTQSEVWPLQLVICELARQTGQETRLRYEWEMQGSDFFFQCWIRQVWENEFCHQRTYTFKIFEIFQELLHQFPTTLNLDRQEYGAWSTPGQLSIFKTNNNKIQTEILSFVALAISSNMYVALRTMLKGWMPISFQIWVLGGFIDKR